MRLCCCSEEVDINTHWQLIAIATMSDASEQDVTELVTNWATSHPAVANGLDARGSCDHATTSNLRMTVLRPKED